MEPPITPYQTINESIFNKTFFECWPKTHFNTIADPILIKVFYNECYKNLEIKLQFELNKYHPAAWILEAYKQIEIWTIIYYEDKNIDVNGSTSLAPIGRYGWRYVIEKSMERLASEFSFQSLRPTEESMNMIFTLLFGMSITSEYSNYLHFIGKNLTTAQIQFSPFLIRKFPTLSKEESVFLTQIQETIALKIDPVKYESISPNNKLVTEKVDLLLKTEFLISIDDIRQIIKSIIEIVNRIEASIIVQPLEDFIEIIHEISEIPKGKIETLLNLSFLEVDENDENRDFLRKSQQNRMLHNAGILISLNSDLGAIYDDRSSQLSKVTNSKKHIIISPRIYAEWLDIFIYKIVLGQREDLKKNTNLKKAIGEIERFYRRSIFEIEVMSLLRRNGFGCFSLAEIDGKPIECGEIDVIAYNPQLKKLLIIECKALAPIIDARGLGQIIKDHYDQKKYHQKFLKKIDWLKNHIKEVKPLFFEKCGMTIDDTLRIIPFYVTHFNSSLKLLEQEYSIMNFSEFDNFLTNGSK